jgi:hypothetical protein
VSTSVEVQLGVNIIDDGRQARGDGDVGRLLSGEQAGSDFAAVQFWGGPEVKRGHDRRVGGLSPAQNVGSLQGQVVRPVVGEIGK